VLPRASQAIDDGEQCNAVSGAKIAARPGEERDGCRGMGATHYNDRAMRDEASVERPSKWEVLMAVNKAHDEFYALDLENGWEVPAGYPAGIEQKILSGSLDEDKRRGSRTRLLRIAPGVFTKEPFVHEYWEEVFLVSGDLTVGNDADRRGGTRFEPFTYACRPPGARHGPFRSDGGCLLYEIHYYDPP
jgi:hypothetical protein